MFFSPIRLHIELFEISKPCLHSYASVGSTAQDETAPHSKQNLFWVVVNSNHEQLGNHWTTMLLLDANSEGQSFAPSHLSCLSKQNWIEYAIVILRQNDKPTWPSTQPQHLPLAFQQWLWNTFGSALTHFHFVPYRFDGLWQSSCVLTNRSS